MNKMAFFGCARPTDQHWSEPFFIFHQFNEIRILELFIIFFFFSLSGTQVTRVRWVKNRHRIAWPTVNRCKTPTTFSPRISRHTRRGKREEKLKLLRVVARRNTMGRYPHLSLGDLVRWPHFQHGRCHFYSSTITFAVTRTDNVNMYFFSFVCLSSFGRRQFVYI